MVLFNDVVEALTPHHFDWDGATKVLQHGIDCFDASSVCDNLVNDDLGWEPIHSSARVKNLVAAALFLRLDSMKSSVFSALSTARHE